LHHLLRQLLNDFVVVEITQYLMCADHKIIGDQVYCKPCDSGSFDWATFTCPQSLISGEAEFNEYCQPESVPPEACNCGNGKGQTGDLEGYVNAKDLFFGRGAIQVCLFSYSRE
jgi:hypothetical protein